MQPTIGDVVWPLVDTSIGGDKIMRSNRDEEMVLHVVEFVYRDVETGELCVFIKRKSGKACYGIHARNAELIQAAG